MALITPAVSHQANVLTLTYLSAILGLTYLLTLLPLMTY